MFTTKILPFLREIVFGLEDGMVSTLGAITGIAGATGNRSLVIISGLVIVAVESLSMAAGTYLSNKSEEQADGIINHRRRRRISSKPVRDGIYMGISYIIGGSLALCSYFFLPVNFAIPTSITLTVIALFTMGVVKGKITRINPWRSGLEMTTVSLTAASVGFVIGKLASHLFPGYTSGL